MNDRPEVLPTDAASLGSDQAMSDAELQEWARFYARSAVDSQHADDASAYVIFVLGGERFAVPLQDLDEVARVECGIGLDHASTLVIGLVNIRGEVVPMLDTAAALRVRGTYQLGSSNRTLVIRDEQGRRTALPVDRVQSIELIGPGQFQFFPDAEDSGAIRRIAIAEHDGHSMTLLDVSGLNRADNQGF
jgi:purine-binding chemotaxis protein CheW